MSDVATRYMTGTGSRALRAIPVKSAGGANATHQRRAFQRMSILQRECGITEAEYREFHAAQRERVLERFGAAA